VIRSISFDQREILSNILTLLDIEYFDADLSFGNGGFYKEIPEPEYKFDINPQREDVTEACSTDLPMSDASICSAQYSPHYGGA
jgi:hypothetical protein